MDISQLMNMAQQLREQLSGAQEEAKRVRVTGDAGGGMVRVVMTGRLELVEVSIDPKVIDPNEKTLLEDLVRAACNDAVAKATQAVQGQVGDLAKQFGIDPSMLGGGGNSP